LLNVGHHLVEDSLDSLRIRGLRQLGSKGFHDVANFGEAVAAGWNATLLRCEGDHGTYQVVGGYGCLDFFCHHVGSQASKLLQTQSALQRAQVGFDRPALAIKFEGHLRQIQDFIDGIRERRPFFIEGVEARKAVALVRAIYDSAASGHPVRPDGA